MVTQMNLTRGRLDGERRVGQKIVSAMHATLGRGLLVLLNGHDYSIFKFTALYPSGSSIRKRGKPSPHPEPLQATHNFRDVAPAEDRE